MAQAIWTKQTGQNGTCPSQVQSRDRDLLAGRLIVSLLVDAISAAFVTKVFALYM